MAAFWLAAIPSGVWATRTIGNTFNESLFSRNRADPPNLLLDHEGALACAEAALRIHPVSPTASHLRELVKQSAERLVKLVEDTQSRIHKNSWSRFFRDPDFSVENRVTTTEIQTLKSRVSLFLSVVQLFPLKVGDVPVGDVPFEKSLPEDHASIDSGDEEEDVSSAENSATDSLDGSAELQPLETSFWQSLLAKASGGDLSGLASPDDSGD